MRISDWSSDVCSSDLGGVETSQALREYILVQQEHRVPALLVTDVEQLVLGVRAGQFERVERVVEDDRAGRRVEPHVLVPELDQVRLVDVEHVADEAHAPLIAQARKSDVEGKSVSERLNP